MADFVIPIEYITRDGVPCPPSKNGDDHAIPVVRLILRFDTTHAAASPVGPSEQVRFALVDTGADDCYATKEALEAVGCPIIKTTNVHGGTGTIPSHKYSGHLLFPGIVQIRADIVATPLTSNGRTYDIVLGMSVLRMGTLVLDHTGDRHELRLPGPPGQIKSYP